MNVVADLHRQGFWLSEVNDPPHSIHWREDEVHRGVHHRVRMNINVSRRPILEEHSLSRSCEERMRDEDRGDVVNDHVLGRNGD